MWSSSDAWFTCLYRFEWDASKFAPDFTISPAEGYIAQGMDVQFSIVFHPQQINSNIRYEVQLVSGPDPVAVSEGCRGSVAEPPGEFLVVGSEGDSRFCLQYCTWRCWICGKLSWFTTFPDAGGDMSPSPSPGSALVDITSNTLFILNLVCSSRCCDEQQLEFFFTRMELIICTYRTDSMDSWTV